MILQVVDADRRPLVQGSVEFLRSEKLTPPRSILGSDGEVRPGERSRVKRWLQHRRVGWLVGWLVGWRLEENTEYIFVYLAILQT